jgi:hypothetical protein
VIRGEELLTANHCGGAQQIMPDEFHHMLADGTGALAAHHGVCVAAGKKKGRRGHQSECRRGFAKVHRECREALRLAHEFPSCFMV